MAISVAALPPDASAEPHEGDLVGRDDAIATTIESLSAPLYRSVVVVGPRGAGATAVLRRVSDELQGLGRTVLWPTPGELARLVATPGGSREIDRADSTTALGQVTDSPRIVIVDDLGSLDRPAVAAVERLSLDRRVQILTSARRPGTAIPEIADTLSRRDGADWIELVDLSVEELDELALGILGGPLDRCSLHELHSLTSGNPGRIATLTAAHRQGETASAITADCFFETEGLWRCDIAEAAALLAEPAFPCPWTEVEPAAGVVIGFVARVGHVPLGLLLWHFDPDAINAAERSGIIEACTPTLASVVPPDTVAVRLSDKMNAAAISALETAAERATIDRIVTAAASSGTAHPELLAAYASILKAQPVLGLDAVDVLIEAAGAAVQRSEPLEALALAQTVSEDRIDAPDRRSQRWTHQRASAALIAAHCLDRLGRNEEALALLERARANTTDEEWLAFFAVRRSMVLARLNDPDAIATLLEGAAASSPIVRTVIDIQRASLLLHAGEVDAALDAVESHAGEHPDILAEAIVVLGPGLAVSGRPLRGLQMAAQARAAILAHPAPLHVSDHSMVDIIEGLCLTEAGELDAAHRAAAAWYAAAVAAGDRWRQAWYALNLGRIGLLTGSSAEALRCFTESAVAFVDVDHPGYRAWALAGAAGAAAKLENPRAARVWADAYDHAAPHDVRLYEPESERLRAWVDQLSGRGAAAVDRLEAALTAANRSGQRGPEIAIAVDLVLLRQALPAEVLTTLHRPDLEGRLNETRRDFVIAATRGQLTELVTVATRFEGIGCRAHALEVWCYAAREFAESDDETNRRRCVRSANALMASGLSCHSPDRSAITGTCSARELQVAELAARGWERREVAAELFISPRTVDRHLNAAFAKLGVTNRSELPAALGREVGR